MNAESDVYFSFRCSTKGRDLVRRYVIEDKRDAVLVALVHYRMRHLVIELVGFADFELVGLAVDHEANPRIRRDGEMNAMADMERGWVSVCGLMMPPVSNFAVIARMTAPPGG